jgi:hypothetical protein
METGGITHLSCSSQKHKTSITTLYWACEQDQPLEMPVGNRLMDRASKLLQLPGAFVEDQSSSSHFAPTRAQPTKAAQRDLGMDILVSGDKDGLVSLFAFGSIPVGYIDVGTSHPGLAGGSISKLCFSADLQTLTVWVKKGESSSLMTVDTSCLWIQRRELRHVATQLEEVSSLVDSITKAVRCMETQWLDGVKQLNAKMTALQTLLRDYGRDPTHTPQDELFLLLTSGVPSTALAQFFTQNLSEAGLTRLQKTVDAACVNMQKLGYEQVQQSIEALVFRLSEMRGLARWRERYMAIGLEEDVVDGILHAAEGTLLKVRRLHICMHLHLLHASEFMVGSHISLPFVSLRLQVEELLVAVHEAQSNFNALFTWLLQTISRLERHNHPDGEPPPGSSSYGTQTAADVMQIAAFLRQVPHTNSGQASAAGDDSSASTFDALLQSRVLQYFRDEPLRVPFPTHIETGAAGRYMTGTSVQSKHTPSFVCRASIRLLSRAEQAYAFFRVQSKHPPSFVCRASIRLLSCAEQASAFFRVQSTNAFFRCSLFQQPREGMEGMPEAVSKMPFSHVSLHQQVPPPPRC